MSDAIGLILALGGPAILLAITGGAPPGPFEKIFFRRDGGGNKAFYVTADDVQKLLSFDVVKYNFRDTSYTFEQSPDEKDDVCGLITSILSGRLSVAGAHRTATKPTGTWAHLYVVTQTGSLVEITDTNLRERLMILEKLVEAQHAGSQP